MHNLTDFLNKYRNIIKDNSSLRQVVSDALIDVCGLSIGLEFIKIRGGSVIITCHQAVKSEIFTKQDALLKIINEKTKSKVKDIRF